MNLSQQWTKRATQHVRVLCQGIGPRAATSDAERQAAEYVHDELGGLGVSDVHLETFRGVTSAWMPWAIAFSIAVWAMLIGLLFGFVGGLIATALYLLASWIAYTELYPAAKPFQGLWEKGYPVRRWLRRGESRNVIGVVQPLDDVQHRVILMAYLDSASVHYLWAGRRRRRLVGCFVPFLFVSLLVNAAAFFLAVVTASVLFYFSALVLLFPQIAALLVCIRADRNPSSPGANNNAAGVGTLLALAKGLKESPLRRTEVWLLFTGCRETGGDGFRVFFEAHRHALPECIFVALDSVGVGEKVVYLTGEGAIWTTSYSAEALAIAVRATERNQDVTGLISAQCQRSGPTEMGLISRLGLKGFTINVRPADGSGPVGRRQQNDVFDSIQRQALTDAQSFSWAVLQEIDSQP